MEARGLGGTEDKKTDTAHKQTMKIRKGRTIQKKEARS